MLIGQQSQILSNGRMGSPGLVSGPMDITEEMARRIRPVKKQEMI